MPDLRPQFLLFILSLLFVGIAFWTGSDLLTKQLLTFSYRTLDKLQVDTLPQAWLKLNFTLVEMKIEPEENLTYVEIQARNSLLQKLELEIPKSEFSEVAIAQKLRLYPQIKKLKRNQHIKVEIPLKLLAIKATLETARQVSFIEVRTTNNSLKKLDFVLPIAEVDMVESMTAQLLNLSVEDVRKLISYQVKPQSKAITTQPVSIKSRQ